MTQELWGARGCGYDSEFHHQNRCCIIDTHSCSDSRRIPSPAKACHRQGHDPRARQVSPLIVRLCTVTTLTHFTKSAWGPCRVAGLGVEGVMYCLANYSKGCFCGVSALHFARQSHDWPRDCSVARPVLPTRAGCVAKITLSSLHPPTSLTECRARPRQLTIFKVRLLTVVLL